MSKVDFYKEQIKKLLPKGKLWEAAPGTYLDKFLEGFAVELSRIDDRAQKLLEEADPRTTFELIDEWEAMTGLPGKCGQLAVTIEERRNQVISKLVMRGSQNKQFFVDIARSVGYEITVDDIIEYLPFVAGSLAGGSLTNGDWVHAFSLRIPKFTIRLFRTGRNSAGDRLVEFGDALLECLINDQKPAHAIALFSYFNEA